MSSNDSSSSHVASSSSSTAHFTYDRIAVDSYEICVGHAHIQQIASAVHPLAKAAKYILLTDSNLDPLYSAAVIDSFTAAKLPILKYVLPPGEASKNRTTKAGIEDWMFAQGCGRDACMLALGGGVIGDLTGYIASTYMRGIPVVQIPTSLLAMVDSSIGGKTGIDTAVGKNLLGTFHRPLLVFIDLQFLQTLPLRELCNGMAEAIKAGAIASERLFSYIESNVEKCLQKDMKVLGEIIYESAKIKADVVLADEREGGIRAILNFGHSIGHAIEALMQPTLLHGECVSIGMIEEAILARTLGLLDHAAITRLQNCLKAYQLPLRIPSHLSIPSLLTKMAIDKKNKNGKKELVMLTSIGSVKAQPYTTTVEDHHLIKLFSPSITVTPSMAHGSIAVPGSKSLSNRILLLAAIGKGTCRIKGLLHSQDTTVMLDSLRELGVKFEWEDNQRILVMHGCEGRLSLPSRPLYLHNAGTASRFLTTLVQLVGTGDIVVTGNERMQERPIADLVNALRNNGCVIKYMNKEGCLPVTVKGMGGFSGGSMQLSANISSQYVSSVLLSAPYALEPLVLKLEQSAAKKVVSKPFIDMTVHLMRQFGINVTEPEPFTYHVQKGVFQNPETVMVEGDASSATYPLALAAVTGGDVTVTNVGSQSLQGDAQFCTLLQQMGCQVTQTATSTTVKGLSAAPADGSAVPHPSLRAIEVDMDSMTDTFMTLCAVAVFATGTTRIVNIANQRLKECNRLKAMVTELTKIGVTARELETGIEVVGLDPGQRTHAATIHCYDDHRIAMSFAVIGARLPGILLDDKRCVDKTFPTFWDDISHYLHVPTAPPADAARALSLAPRAADSSVRAVVVIGMRGAGKTTLSAFASKYLSFAHIDLDATIEKEALSGESIRSYVEREGFDAFRKCEWQVFQSVWSKYAASNTIISCGGGIVEIPGAVQFLSSLPCVVLLNRHISDVVTYLNADTTRPAFDAETVYERRKPLYRQASNYEFTIRAGDSNWANIQQDFVHFLRVITRTPSYEQPIQLENGTAFLSLTYPDVEDFVYANTSDITKGVDALELRVDLLQEHTASYIQSQLALLRRHVNLPIIYTVRSKSQGGAFPDDEHSIFELLRLGVRYGCEYVDMESHWALQARTAFLQQCAHAQIIASYHVPHSNGGSEEELSNLFRTCAHDGKVGIVKVVVMAAHENDAVRISYLANSVAFPSPSSVVASRPRIIALAMGSKGQLSRVLNQTFTPVTHPSLPFAAAPGQLSVRQIQQFRESLGIITPRSYYLFGSPITYSLSPLMHNTGFEWFGLPYKYEKCETSDVSEVAAVLKRPNVYGANVTIPLKEQVLPLLDEVSDVARTIGAVNTIIRLPDNRLRGDNTDWYGMHTLISFALSVSANVPAGTNPSQLGPNDVVLVCGAGGTARAACYALQQMGFTAPQQLFIYNRTEDKATKLAQAFNGTAVKQPSRDALRHAFAAASGTADSAASPTVRVIINTVPGSAEFKVHDDLFTGQRTQPVVLEASYMPYHTHLTLQAEEYGCMHIFHGIDLLIAQGLQSFQHWIGRSAACTIMAKTVRAQYMRNFVYDKYAQ